MLKKGAHLQHIVRTYYRLECAPLSPTRVK